MLHRFRSPRAIRRVQTSLLFLALAASAPLGCRIVSGGWDTFVIDATQVHALDVRDALVVETVNGSVDVTVDPTRADMEVVAHIRGSGTTDAEARARAAAIRFDVESSGGRTRVTLRIPDERRPSEGASFEIRVPGQNGVEVTTSNGAVTLAGCSGEGRVHTSNGTVAVSNHHGPVTVESSNGSLAFERVDGRVSAHTSNGTIVLRAPPDLAFPFDVESSNGDVRVELPGRVSATIRAKTSNGPVVWRGSGPPTQDAPGGSRGERTITLGDCALACSVRTSNGTVTVQAD